MNLDYQCYAILKTPIMIFREEECLYANPSAFTFFNVSTIEQIKEILIRNHINLSSLQDSTFYEVELKKIIVISVHRLEDLFILEFSDKTAEEKALLLDKIFHTGIEGMLFTDKENKIIDVNPAFSAITGYSKEEVIGKDPNILKSGKHSKEFYDNMWQSLEEKGFWANEIWNKRKNEDIYLEYLTIQSISGHLPIRYLAMLNDISHLRAFEARMRMELQLAEKIQLGMLPDIPQIPNLKIETLYKPMERLGGDFYDFMPLPEKNKLGIFISDVSGHGVPAAFITAILKTILLSSTNHWEKPCQLLSFLNQKLLNRIEENFLTAFYGVYCQNTMTLTYCRAAHPKPIIVRDGELLFLDTKGSLMLGVFADLEFKEYQISLKPKDRVYFYTDGLLEVMNTEKETFEDHFYNALLKYHSLPLAKTIERVYYELLLFQEKNIFDDDICMVGLEIE